MTSINVGSHQSFHVDFSAVCSPLAFLANSWLALDLKDNHRRFFCGLLIQVCCHLYKVCKTLTQARFTTAYVYMTAMLFNIFFRAFFILYPDYGLVKDGQPDLRLVHQLYWVVLSSFILVNHAVLPLSFLIKGTFPEGTGPGRLCLGLGNMTKDEMSPHQQTQDNAKLTIMQFMTPLLVTIFNCYVCWRVRRFVRGHCPRGRLSCIGVYRRNVITLKETSSLLYILCFSSFIDSAIQAVFPNLDKVLDGKVLFWIWNLKGISFNEGLFLTLPIFFDIPFEGNPSKGKVDFYVLPPRELLPRPPDLTSSYSLLFPVLSASQISSSSSSPGTLSQPLSICERKDVMKETIFSGKSSQLMLSIPTNQHCNHLNKKYRTTFYCRQHHQIERIKSQP